MIKYLLKDKYLYTLSGLQFMALFVDTETREQSTKWIKYNFVLPVNTGY